MVIELFRIMSYNATLSGEATPTLQKTTPVDPQKIQGNEVGENKVASRDFAVNPPTSFPTPGPSPQYALLQSNSSFDFTKIDLPSPGTLVESKAHNLSLDTQKSKGATIIRRNYAKGGHELGRSNSQRDPESRLKTISALNAYMEGDKGAGNILASIARSDGIASDLRTTIWPILLDTHPMVMASTLRRADSNQNVPIKRIRTEIAKYHRRQKGLPSTRYPSPPTSASPGSLSIASTSTNSSSIASIDSHALDEFSLDTAVEEAVVSFLESHSQIEYSHGIVHVCLTLSDWLITPLSISDVSDDEQETQSARLTTCFDQIMMIMHWNPQQAASDEDVCCRRIAHFLALFRRLMPELTAYFDEEEANVPSEEWIQSWIQWWCAKELSTAQKSRLWDFYLGYRPSDVLGESPGPQIECSDGDGEGDAPLRPQLPGKVNEGDHEAYTPADWHPYVCLALLRASKDELEELELSEIRTLLGHLPAFDMGAILKEAEKLRREAKELARREEAELDRRKS
jgi:hypothetical protein